MNADELTVTIPTRKILHEMTTQQLYDLSGMMIKITKKIDAELILRGDY
jgi:hypothetical protein